MKQQGAGLEPSTFEPEVWRAINCAVKACSSGRVYFRAYKPIVVTISIHWWSLSETHTHIVIVVALSRRNLQVSILLDVYTMCIPYMKLETQTHFTFGPEDSMISDCFFVCFCMNCQFCLILLQYAVCLVQ